MIAGRTTMVEGVRLPAAEVADAVRAYLTSRQLEDRQQRRRGVPAFDSEPWAEAVRRLRMSARGHSRAENWTRERWITCAEYAVGSVWCSPRTVRRWAAAGQFGADAVKRGGVWLIRADAPLPATARRQTTKGTTR